VNKILGIVRISSRKRHTGAAQGRPMTSSVIHLGSAVELTQSDSTGTTSDGEIHGAHRLKHR